MSHPFFDAKSYPWHRDEAGALHHALSVSIVDARDIERWYRRSGADLPGLAHGTPEHFWQSALENMTSARTLRRFCELLLANNQHVVIHSEIRAVVFAEGEVPEAIPATDSADKWLTYQSLVEMLFDMGDSGIEFVLRDAVINDSGWLAKWRDLVQSYRSKETTFAAFQERCRDFKALVLDRARHLDNAEPLAESIEETIGAHRELVDAAASEFESQSEIRGNPRAN